MDDETVARIKEFLSDKLSDKDHTKLCAMLNGEGDVEAEDDNDNDKDNLPRAGVSAADAQADFLRRFPDAARIRLDNSGIPIPRRAATSASDAKSFF